MVDRAWIGVVGLLVAATWACASAAPPVPVSGEAAAIASLAGSWSGRYESPTTGRRGSISFDLQAGSDTARGEVQMIPAGADEPIHALEPAPSSEGGGFTRSPHFLTIRFVTVAEGKVRGCLEPYRDPVTGHTLRTTFRGAVRDDSIIGTFQTSDDRTGERSAGRWWVTRGR